MDDDGEKFQDEEELLEQSSESSIDEDEDEDNIEHDTEDKDFEEKLNFLKSSIEENKFTYQNYVDIIELTRNHGDLNNLRIYREKMSELFPLTESNKMKTIALYNI